MLAHQPPEDKKPSHAAANARRIANRPAGAQNPADRRGSAIEI
jgi:hypothetical protein